MQRPHLILLIVGICLLVFSVSFGYFGFPSLLQGKIKTQIRLENNTETYNRWKDTPIPILMKVYLFVVTNPDDFSQGSMPILEEKGPYVYQQKREKVVELANPENDTVKFRPKITYSFRSDLSNGTEDDTISVINIPYASVAATKMSNAARYLVLSELKQHPDESLFMTRKVGELLFQGYFVPFMKDLAEMKGETLLPNNTFGIYYGKNGTAQDLFEIVSGFDDHTKFGNTLSWNGRSELEFWNETTTCKVITGSDGSIFPPFLDRDRILRIFSPDMCRSIYMTYAEDVDVQGIQGYRFSTPKSVLGDARKFPENLCYCDPPNDPEEGDPYEGCMKDGVFKLAACRKGAPIVASWPHFYDGDPEYINGVVGLNPQKDRHETFLTLQPNTASLLQAAKRFQINIQIGPNKYFKPLKKVPQVLLPLLWVDESVELTEELIWMVKRKLIIPMKVVGYSTPGIACLGVVLILTALVLHIKSKPEMTKFSPSPIVVTYKSQ